MRRRGLQGSSNGIKIEFDGELLCFTAGENCQFSFTNDIYYSTDQEKWELLPKNTYTPTISRGEKIWWYANIPSSSNGIGTFSSTGYFNISGNPLCLMNGNKLASDCFRRLFYNCNKLKNAENLILDSKSLLSYCYAGMFEGCSSLITAPELPTKILALLCYHGMFWGCSSLTQAPELPATTLANYCYYNMFHDCSSLTQAPELSATVLKDSCYAYMFYGCTSLTQAPELLATTLVEDCYSNMFYNCNKLNYVKSHATNINASGCLTNWLYGVSSNGDFYKPEGVDYLEGVSGIPSDWTKHDMEYLMFEVEEGSSSIFTFTDSVYYKTDNDANWITLKAKNSTPSFRSGTKVYWMGDLVPNSFKSIGTFSSTGYFSVSGNPLSLLKNNELVNNCFNSLFYGCYRLKSAENLILDSITLTNGCYSKMFHGCDSLMTAPKLPATTLADYCYQHMFEDCELLTTAPELPATTLADYCYSDMFYNCTSLTQAPALPATELAPYCYYYMFKDCTSLDSSPELPATMLEESCYEGMFYGCTSLTQAPALPATELETYCYGSMFYGCSKLISVPELPATKLAVNCYDSMFYNCTSLTQAPALPATELTIYCYANMFSNCSKLNYVKSYAANIDASGCLYEWLSGVSSAGDFYKPSDVTYPTGASGIPGGWTKHNIEYLTFDVVTDSSFKFSNTIQYSTDQINWIELPANNDTPIFSTGAKLYWKGELTTNIAGSIGTFSSTGQFNISGNPIYLSKGDKYCNFGQLFKNCVNLVDASGLILNSTTLKDLCYMAMFKGCTSLTTAPELPATNLASYCYRDMFSGCSKLNYVKSYAANIDASDCLTNWLNGVSSDGDFYGVEGVGYSTGASGIPSGWTKHNIKYLTFEVVSDSSFKFNRVAQYSTDQINWVELPANTDTPPFVPGTNVYWKGGLTTNTLNGIGTFSSTGQFNVSGNPIYLIKGNKLMAFSFFKLFMNCTNLVDASRLILDSTTLTSYCYPFMFRGCTSLKIAPELPATTLKSYCYDSMFDGCVSLTQAPELPATNLASYCYRGMFRDCSSLNYVKSHAIDISATDCLTNWLNGVSGTGEFHKPADVDYPEGSSGIPSGWKIVSLFQITSLEDGEISFKQKATGSVRYSKDLINWEELVSETPIEVVSNDIIYFEGALDTNGSSIGQFSSTCKFNLAGNPLCLINNSKLDKWCFSDLFADTKVVDASKLELPSENISELPYCYAYMFDGCSELISAPELPAHSLSEGCYCFMFQNCSELTAAPELPATVLKDSCYTNMFNGCTKLNYVYSYATDIDASGCLIGWLNGVSSDGEFYKPADVEYSEGPNGIPSGWDVYDIV